MEHDPVTPPLHARVRWGNVAKALALLAVLVLVAAWPHLRAPDPQIPPGAAVPVRQPLTAKPAPAPEETATTAVPEPVGTQPDAAPEPRRPARRKPRAARRKARDPQPRAPQTQPSPPRPAPTWRGRARMGAEFSVE